jgi:sulfane dehydrogenase subunit SoxC
VSSALPSGTAEAGAISPQELLLAARNHGMPLEALSYDVTPVGMHYLLIHYDVPRVDASTWRLEVDGNVARPLSLSLDDLRARETVSADITFECAGNGRALLDPRPISQPWVLEAVGTGAWTGAPLAALLADAGIGDDAVEVLFTGLDRGVEGEVEQAYQRSLPLADALADDVLLAFGMNGGPLPPQHGFPLRLVVPGWYGMTNVKWLSRITLLDEPFAGYQNARGYRFRRDPDEEGTAVTRMAVRSLMVPPGIPDFMTRERVVRPGTHVLRGRAWSGRGAISRVEVSVDGGRSWADADVAPASSPHAWASWSFDWDAQAVGEHELCCRATDETGASQPLEPDWNVQGMENNAVQRVRVLVAAPDGE